MKCACCENESSIYDGFWTYCLTCVKTKKIDETIPETERVEWEYCQHCKNIIRMEDFIGPCDMLLACKQREPMGYTHLCSDCGTTYDHSDQKLTSCLPCKIYMKKLLKN